MSKFYFSLGLMSGTSADGVDASIIQSNGDIEYKVILDKYFKYKESIYNNIHSLKDEIKNSKDLENLSSKIQPLEKEITIFHADVVNKIAKEFKKNIDFVGFHGQTIFHNAEEKISKQLGNGNLLSKLTKKSVVYNFRKNDLENGGHGAPLTPIFHKLLKIKFKIKDATFVNIGGITNVTTVDQDNKMSGTDIGPGMCLIDRWIRNMSKKKYDEKGIIAKSGKVNEIALNHLLQNFDKKKKLIDTGDIHSFDTKFFDFSFVEKLSLVDGAATLTEFTAKIIISSIKEIKRYKEKIILCGGGRKNDLLVKKLRDECDRIKLIDDYKVDGDFIESQAFAYLAIRSILKLPISFPETTGVKRPSTGGLIINN